MILYMLRSMQSEVLYRFHRSKRFKSYMAVVGSGPSGLYTAKYLLETNNEICVDVFEKMPTPFGLIRYGVAPDHPDVKSVMSQFCELFDKYGRNLRYFGNVDVGGPFLSVDTLQKNYKAVVLAYGSSSDKRLGIEGEDLDGVISARAFVNWYNGHPDFSWVSNKIASIPSLKRVVIVGQGNVAVDCARILCKPSTDLMDTDISHEALKVLSELNIEEVSMIGRRGHVQASFTIKEIRELSRLNSVRICISKEELAAGLTESSRKELEGNRPKTRIVELIQTLANAEPTAKARIDLRLRFLRSPVRILDRRGENCSFVSHIDLVRNQLMGEPGRQTVEAQAHAQESMESLPCDLVLKAVGYRSVSIEGVPFDAQSLSIPHKKGRVIRSTSNEGNSREDNDGQHDEQVVVKGLYVSGWLKRGPSGIIGSNIPDAKETAHAILEDLSSGALSLPSQPPNKDPLDSIPQLHSAVSWVDYLILDREESNRGLKCNPPKPREKILSVEEMLLVIKKKKESAAAS